MRITVFASGPLIVKATVPSESKVIYVLISPCPQAHRAIREIKEFMPYFITPKIASSGH
jgi:hypothetical protein